uniref:Uncharacterized protein n=1 Tax=Panagrolaimus davidi TaxID=227884 RepID=A0A914RDT2_9BILA
MNRPSSQPQKPPTQWDTAAPHSLLPENTSETLGIQNQSFQMGKNATEQINGEQIEWLIKRLNTDDHQEIVKLLLDCTIETTLTRGLPFAALVTGSIYIARSRFLKSLRFGPKRWPYYAMTAAGSFSAANLLSMYNCGQRVKPKMYELYQKYTANQPNQTMTYESLRAANRQYGAAPQSYGISTAQQDSPQPLDEQRPGVYPALPPKSGYFYEDAPTISGTPFSPTTRGNEPREKPTRGGTCYGDKGFS